MCKNWIVVFKVKVTVNVQIFIGSSSLLYFLYHLPLGNQIRTNPSTTNWAYTGLEASPGIQEGGGILLRKATNIVLFISSVCVLCLIKGHLDFFPLCHVYSMPSSLCFCLFLCQCTMTYCAPLLDSRVCGGSLCVCVCVNNPPPPRNDGCFCFCFLGKGGHIHLVLMPVPCLFCAILSVLSMSVCQSFFFATWTVFNLSFFYILFDRSIDCSLF